MIRSSPYELEGRRTVRARANLLSLEVWHFTLRFDLPGVGLANSVNLERRVVDHWTPRLQKASISGGVVR